LKTTRSKTSWDIQSPAPASRHVVCHYEHNFARAASRLCGRRDERPHGKTTEQRGEPSQTKFLTMMHTGFLSEVIHTSAELVHVTIVSVQAWKKKIGIVGFEERLSPIESFLNLRALLLHVGDLPFAFGDLFFGWASARRVRRRTRKGMDRGSSKRLTFRV